MEAIDKFLNEFLGTFDPVFVPVENVGTYMFLDVMWILKAILLVVCVIYSIKAMFALVSTLSRGL